MFRIKAGSLASVMLALVVSCSSSGSPPSSPPPPLSLPQPPSELDKAAVSLGVAIDAHSASGPRLVRAIVPRIAAGDPEAAARDHLSALQPLWLTAQRAADLTTKGVQTLRNGATLVRLEQRIGDVPIHASELRVLVQRDGSLAAVSGTMAPGGGRVTFQSTAALAVERALDARYGANRAQGVITEAGKPDPHGYVSVSVAASPGLVVQQARSRRELLPLGDRLIPVHVVELFSETVGLDGKVEPSARRYLIGDDGRVLRDLDLIVSDAFVYRVLAETTGNRRPLDGAFQSYAPHPRGIPDGSLPELGPYNLVVQEAFNGPRDPWLGARATTTSGNNVDAFADIALPGGFSPGDIRPDVRAGRTLTHRYDFTAEPLANPEQSKAAAVNVFYVTNYLHDWYYDSGFTEATGNAQLDNFGRGGIGGDPISARAQALALAGVRDNATMATPADGLSPVMNMFLWSGVQQTTLIGVTGTPSTGFFTNTPRIFELTEEVVLAVDVDGGGATACGPVTSAVAGKIAFVRYAFACPSDLLMDNVAAAGAVGLIVMIDFSGFPPIDLTGSVTSSLPAVVLGFDDGEALQAALPTTVTIAQTSTIEKDGDFDNAIVAHEWGHYLHHRLAPCSAVTQCRAMSEGWGDFTALLMMLRPEDNRDGTFAPGLFALSAGGLGLFGFVDPGYFGIRRFPYSLDRSKNPLSFRHIGDDAELPNAPTNPGPSFNFNSETHNAGEVWAQMLWENYNALIDSHGITEARRRMTDYVVAGLLLTPPEATFTEARDALLAAAAAFDSDDQLLMAAAFAGRGAGTCAQSPPQTSVDLTGVVESGTLAAKLATSSATLVDDGASCDRDGYLDPGESGTLHLTVANHGVIPAEDVVIRATTASTGVTLGRPVSIAAIAPFSQVDIAIPVRLALSAPANAALDIAISVEGAAGCNTRRLAVEFHERMGVDEVATGNAGDNFETRSVGWTPTGFGAEDFWRRALGLGANHVLFNVDAPIQADTQMVSPALQASPTAPLVIAFKHAFDFEIAFDTGEFFDGAVVEISNDGGATWRDVAAVGAQPGYLGVISPSDPSHALRFRPGYGGRSAGFPALLQATLDFGTQFAGQSVQLRFRSATDFCCGFAGWLIDDVAVSGIVNAPFPRLIAEPTRCTGGTLRTADSDPDAADSVVLSVRGTPRRSLSRAGAAGAK